MYMQEMIWFVGVVEDNNDPAKLGRLKVRCLGYHTENKDDLLTSDLPWASVMQPITSAAVQGIGQSPTGIVQGTHVVGFFRDGKYAQDPVVMGTLAGASDSEREEPKGRFGFEDPDKKYPGTSRASISGLATHTSGDINPLATDGTHTSTITDRNSTVTIDVPIANTTTTWAEPTSANAATYPNNHVMETESGHVKEYDDTSGKERIHEYHKAGTFYEIDSEGNKVTRIVGDNYQIVAGSEYVNVKGTVHLTIDSNCNTYIKGNWNIQVDGNKVEKVKGNVTETYTANQTTNVTETLTVLASTNIDIDSTRIDMDAGTINLNSS